MLGLKACSTTAWQINEFLMMSFDGNKAKRSNNDKKVCGLVPADGSTCEGALPQTYDLSLIPGTHMVEENFHELSSNFHIYIHNLYKHLHTHK